MAHEQEHTVEPLFDRPDVLCYLNSPGVLFQLIDNDHLLRGSKWQPYLLPFISRFAKSHEISNPAHIAAYLDKSETLKILYSVIPTSFLEPSGLGETVVHVAARNHSSNAIKVLKKLPSFGDRVKHTTGKSIPEIVQQKRPSISGLKAFRFPEDARPSQFASAHKQHKATNSDPSPSIDDKWANWRTTPPEKQPACSLQNPPTRSCRIDYPSFGNKNLQRKNQREIKGSPTKNVQASIQM